MILGLSHIALGAEDIERATARLAEFGYTTRFDEPELENHLAKTPMLAQYRPLHHIRSLAAPGGVMAIELLKHGPLSGGQAGLIPVFRRTEPLAGWQELDESALPLTEQAWPLLEMALAHRPRVFYDLELQITLLWIPSDQAPGLFACVLPTENTAAVGELLMAIRFRPNHATGLWSMLTPLPSLQARMIPAPYHPHGDWQMRAPLDAPGCACIAFMSRGTSNSPLPPALQGETVAFSLIVNSNPCTITLIRPEHGPVIELVEQRT